jgi:hypothetical protein
MHKLLLQNRTTAACELNASLLYGRRLSEFELLSLSERRHVSNERTLLPFFTSSTLYFLISDLKSMDANISSVIHFTECAC